MVQVGDAAVYDTAIFLSGDKVVSPYLDNRISCAVLLRVLEELDACPNDLYLVFSAQGEVGLRGAGRRPGRSDRTMPWRWTSLTWTARLGEAGHPSVWAGSGGQGDGPLGDLPPSAGGDPGAAGRGDPRPAGHHAGRRHRCGGHPYHPHGSADRERPSPAPGISTPPRRCLTWGTQRPA